jgi:hypothetical protein
MQSYQLRKQICQEPALLPNAQVIWQRCRLWLENTPATPNYSSAFGESVPFFAQKYHQHLRFVIRSSNDSPDCGPTAVLPIYRKRTAKMTRVGGSHFCYSLRCR